MSDSILDSIKEAVSIESDDDSFNAELLLLINSELSIANQLGVGSPISIADATATWTTFMGSDPRLNIVKSYIAKKVRLAFDPPTNSFLVDNLKKLCEEESWRITVLIDEINRETEV